MVVVFDAELWGWDARRAESWIFVSLPAEASEEIRDLAAGPRRGCGSLPVQVTVGVSTWTTSIFPDSVRGGYVLPIAKFVGGVGHESETKKQAIQVHGSNCVCP